MTVVRMIVALVDIVRRPEWEWEIAGHEETLWLLLVILVNFLAILIEYDASPTPMANVLSHAPRNNVFGHRLFGATGGSKARVEIGDIVLCKIAGNAYIPPRQDHRTRQSSCPDRQQPRRYQRVDRIRPVYGIAVSVAGTARSTREGEGLAQRSTEGLLVHLVFGEVAPLVQDEDRSRDYHGEVSDRDDKPADDTVLRPRTSRNEEDYDCHDGNREDKPDLDRFVSAILIRRSIRTRHFRLLFHLPGPPCSTAIALLRRSHDAMKGCPALAPRSRWPE